MVSDVGYMSISAWQQASRVSFPLVRIISYNNNSNNNNNSSNNNNTLTHRIVRIYYINVMTMACNDM